MLTRRHLLLSGAGALAGTAVLGRTSILRAQDRPFTFVSWGGALSETERLAFMDPYSEMTGKEIVNTSPTSYAKIKAMADSGNIEWDLATVGGHFVYQGAESDSIEKLDLDRMPNAANLRSAWVSDYGIATSAGATVIGWNTDSFPEGEGPQSWKDFWDVKRFPGPRGLYKRFYYNYEAALRADGVPVEEIYPASEEKVKIAFGKLKEIKPHVRVWWSSGAQPPQLLSSGQLAMSSVWSGRVIAIQRENAPVAYTYKDGVAWGNWVVVVKGTPYRDMAMDVLNYAVSLEAQKRLLGKGSYGPVLGAAADAATAEQRKELVMAEENVEHMVLLNEKQVSMYQAKYEEDWNQFQLS